MKLQYVSTSKDVIQYRGRLCLSLFLGPLVSSEDGSHLDMFELDGFGEGSLAPPILAVVRDPAHLQEEADAARVTLGGSQVQGRAPVVVPNLHVHSLLVRTETSTTSHGVLTALSTLKFIDIFNILNMRMPAYVLNY